MSANRPFSKAALLGDVAAGWERFQAYLATLTAEQMSVPADAAGWTAKDHVMHLAVWEDGVQAAMTHESRSGRMGISDELLASRDFEAINAVIQQAHQHLSADEVMEHFKTVHGRMVSTIESMSEADLLKPFRTFQPNSTSETPIVEYVIGDTYSHYDEHQKWIDVIVNG